MCQLVNKRCSALFDARCNHEVYVEESLTVMCQASLHSKYVELVLATFLISFSAALRPY